MTTQQLLLKVFFILFIHWVADFVLQTNWQAQNKSKDDKALTLHVVTYAIVTTIAWWIAFQLSFDSIVEVFIITYLSHWLTDYCTSRLNSYLWQKKDVHNFFVSVGFDQLLHFVQLFFTFYLIQL
jgi:hypothetical protein